MNVLRRFSAALALPLLLASASAPARTPDTISRVETAGLVSAADPRAAEAGADVLRQGGSATDGAIATMLALTVVEPQSSGIGGGGFLLLADAHGRVTSYDGRETAPAAAGEDWFMKDGQPLPFAQARRSGLSVGVPGNLRLAALAHARHGRLPWPTLFEPAIKLARDGFRITPRLHEFLTKSQDIAAHDPDGRALFFDAQGAPLPAGTLVRNPALAETLQRIAGDGAESFYKGRHAEALAAEVAAGTPRPTGMAAADIAAYQAKERPPLCGAYRSWRICSMGPPSSGATTVLAVLGQLERFDMAGLGSTSPVAWHLFAESQRLAYADREVYLADPDFGPVPAEGLVSRDYLNARSALMSPVTTMAKVEAGSPPGAAPASGDGDEPEEHGTSHFVAVDRWGGVASFTSTIEASFGSGIVSQGFYLNNELTDFSFAPEKGGKPVANRVAGGKRPRSSMAPTLAWSPDERLALAVGAAGGATIPAQVARVLIGVIDWGLPIEKAIALPVLFSPGDTVHVEPGTALEAMMPSLVELGHGQVTARAMPLKTNAAQRDGSGWRGAADPRSEGATVSE